MKILHIDLQEMGNDRVELLYFWDNPNEVKTDSRLLSEIETLTKKADTDYYTRLPVDYAITGKALYNWLDSSERILKREIDKYKQEGIILAISTSKRLAHLPWEVLHDGQGFLVGKLPAIIPIRWVKTENHRQLNFCNEASDRALNVLFMASSARGVEPELDFEDEEGKILEATRKKPLSLTVEESGCLEELCELVKSKEKGYFDVIHLTGHATFKENKPCFITETEYGDRQDTSAEDIARGLQFNLPKLIFLSGCRTGYSSEDEILSMAEKLLKLGAKAVLGWGQNVKDSDASLAGANLYQELATGSTLSESLAETYQELLKCQARDWHCLRLYVTENIPEALVTRGNKPLPPASIVDEFIDPETRHLRVASRETFVGRRRELQNCLKDLKTQSSQKVGVLIQGMGGNGKSTIAARLCDRLSDHEKLVWWRQVDETSLVDKLADKLRNREQRQALKNSQEELKYRLKDTFESLNTKPFLLIFDDFEWNLEYRGDRYILKPEIAEIMKALEWAIKETNYYHRIIITCRYEFEANLVRSLYCLPSLRSLSKADLQKKLRRLDKFKSDEIEESYLQRALKLADGNPRLLEWLNNDVLSAKDIDSELTKYENCSDSWRDKIIWRLEEQPKLETDENIEKVVSRCLIYEIPVPLEALETVCVSVPHYKEKLKQAKQRGLIEESPERTGEKLYRASHIHHINPFIELPQNEQELSKLSRIAAEKLNELWGNKDNENEERWGEIFRLFFADKENPRRFQEQFSKMLEVQYNSEADQAYKQELRKLKDELSIEHLFEDLEAYLKQKDWKKADEETARIFYQVMVMEGYNDFYDLFTEMSLDIIEKIDRLWVEASEGKFGIKGQAKIYQDLGETEEYNGEIFDKFGDLVGWREGENWLEYEEVTFNTTAKDSHLPILQYYRLAKDSHLPMFRYYRRFFCGWGLGVGGCGALLSRQDLKDCSI